MRVLAFLFILLAFDQATLAQRGDSLLLNETKLVRPLNMHRNQLRISGAHALALSSSQFIGTTKTPNSETGRTRTFSGIDLDINYGLTEHLQARIVWNRTAEIITEPALFDGFGSDFYIFNSSVQKIGWDDPEVWIDFRLPFVGARTDIVFNLGSSLPLMNSGADRSLLRIVPSDIIFGPDIEFQRISTIERLNTGNGVARLGYGVQFKHRFEHIAFNFQSTYYLPLSTETVDRWVLSDNGSDLISESYERQLSDLLKIYASMEAQVRPWLNVSLGVISSRSRNGWNEIEEQKLFVPTSKLTQTIFSYEIIASKNLWIGQSLNLTMQGSDVFAPVLLTSSVKYNLFL